MMETILVFLILTVCLLNMVAVVGLTALIIKNNKITDSRDSGSENDQGIKPNPQQDDPDAIEKAKREYRASQEAFEKMMNYNAYQAYGMQPTKEE